MISAQTNDFENVLCLLVAIYLSLDVLIKERKQCHPFVIVQNTFT